MCSKAPGAKLSSIDLPTAVQALVDMQRKCIRKEMHKQIWLGRWASTRMAG